MPDLPELKIRTPDNQVQRIPLDKPSITLGRATGNDLCYPDDASLSRRHLRIDKDDEGWSVTDLKSKNGTLLNGTRISQARRLRPGDQLSAGQISMSLVEKGAEDEVVFVAGSGKEMLPSATVMTSLEGVLSADTTAPELRPDAAPAPSRAAFELPVVRALIRAGRELAGHQPLEELFPLILDLSIEAVEAERGVLLTLEDDRLVPRAVSGEGLRISTLVRDRVINERASILVQDIAQEESLRERHSISSQQIHSLMAVPLQTESRVIGLVYVDSRLFVREFTPEDLSLLTVLANVAAIRIEHERFLRMQQMEVRLTRDLKQAAEIQRSILPDDPPVMHGLELAGHNIPSRTVGGDYYDFIGYPDGKICVLLGDVAGKGMAAALLVSSLAARAQLLTEDVSQPAEIVSRLDKSLGATMPDNRFITLFACVIDPRSGQVIYCNGGHNPPLLVHTNGQATELEAAGAPLGIMAGLSNYEQSETTLEIGEMLVIFSDGVTEAAAPGEEEEEFGTDRLLELLKIHREEPSRAIVSHVIDALDAWVQADSHADDVTLVVIRRSAPGQDDPATPPS